MGSICQLSFSLCERTWRPSTRLLRFLPQPASSVGFSSSSAVSSANRLPVVEDAVVVDVDATDELRSRLAGPVPGDLIGLRSWHILAFSTGVNHLYSSGGWSLTVMWVCLSISLWATRPILHELPVRWPAPRPVWRERPPPYRPVPTAAT